MKVRVRDLGDYSVGINLPKKFAKKHNIKRDDNYWLFGDKDQFWFVKMKGD